MPRTRHAIIAAIAVVAILIGLLIAVRVFAPNESEFEQLPAAVIFSNAAEDAVYTVTTLPVFDTAAVRAALIEKVEAEGSAYEPEPVVETPVTPPVREPVNQSLEATSTADTKEDEIELEMETEIATTTPAESDEPADEEAVIEEE